MRFDREWRALRAYAAERGVKLIGDIPIYVAEGSADQLAHPEIFKAGAVAGVPPDAFTDKGQLWGNPLYDWRELRRQGYAWWIARFKRVFELFDLARIDHFRGVRGLLGGAGRRRVRAGGRVEARPGPRAVRRRPRGAGRAAADRRGPRRHHPAGRRGCASRSGLPGMSVLQFGFTPGEQHTVHVPENNSENQVVYTGTHDSDTIRGWYESITPRAARAGATPASSATASPTPSPTGR